MKLALALLAGLAVSASAVRNPPVPAQPAAAPDAAANGAAPAAAEPKPEPYVLKNKSSFSLTDEMRPPFWPIGMKGKIAPTVAKAAPTVPKNVYKEPVLKAEYFTVTSILLGGRPPIATMNGHSYSQGEMVPVVFDGHRINLVMRQVVDGGVQLAQGENVFWVPLRRQELGPNSNPEPVINTQSRVLDLDASGASKQQPK